MIEASIEPRRDIFNNKTRLESSICLLFLDFNRHLVTFLEIAYTPWWERFPDPNTMKVFKSKSGIVTSCNTDHSSSGMVWYPVSNIIDCIINDQPQINVPCIEITFAVLKNFVCSEKNFRALNFFFWVVEK